MFSSFVFSISNVNDKHSISEMLKIYWNDGIILFLEGVWIFSKKGTEVFLKHLSKKQRSEKSHLNLSNFTENEAFHEGFLQ